MGNELIQKERLREFHPKTSVTVLSKGRVICIAISTINHISKYGNQTVIYTDSENYHTCHSLKELLIDLPVNDFFRVHRSYIVSVKHMYGTRKGKIIVGQYAVPVSKYYKMIMLTRLKEILDREYCFGEGITAKESMNHELFNS